MKTDMDAPPVLGLPLDAPAVNPNCCVCGARAAAYGRSGGRGLLESGGCQRGVAQPSGGHLMTVRVCRACDEPIADPDDAVLLWHEESMSGPPREVWGHREHADLAGPDPSLLRILARVLVAKAMRSDDRPARNPCCRRRLSAAGKAAAFTSPRAGRPPLNSRPPSVPRSRREGGRVQVARWPYMGRS